MLTESFTAIVTSHANQAGLTHMLGNLIYQTRPPDDILVLCSDTPGLRKLIELFPDVTFSSQPNREDWGHDKRRLGVELAAGDWLGFFNDDDSYDVRYIEKMMQHSGPGIDAVYCWWKPFGACSFELGSSTSGNFIVRSNLAREVGYPSDLTYENDGIFINEIAQQAREIMCVPETLYYWNDPSVPRGD